ncbi:glycoside hydrolase family 3 protein [Alkalimonas amylolytica]|uniref:beta-N-acetylhexosaminidase n=1 Tax=Alkalimonas amylolytica TaxID=152573 RepID=A0A1H3XX40_ALKAM|nr:glycoside hydrolase family 3 protein [Alkalimonas amylolytica]SEA03174.1 beta-N-acetylhexosaminidase [Alkalimonas amylolytica]
MKKRVLHFGWIATIAGIGLYLGLTAVQTELSLEQKIAQKLMIDVRYFCPQPGEEACRQPVTRLPDELRQLIRDTGLGGVILFAENLQTPEQIIDLTQDLQQAAMNSPVGQPLFISVDQEGGRVFRTPRSFSTGFSGNMAIGATYARHGVFYAEQVGTVLGKELAVLGINTNHAPVVDVNSNPANPVINVRAFGEHPQPVAELSVALLSSMQQQGVLGTLKHFPGHGDTYLDSHLALPLVSHTHAHIEQLDLAPFQWAIEHTEVPMIMTAHIQYPALDASTIFSTAGQSMIRPATMSRAILTDLLRQQMGFEGLVITDALDMAAISHYFTPIQAVQETFAAGADIALMPYPIRRPEDLVAFKALIAELASAVRQGELSAAELETSWQRIRSVKQRWLANTQPVVDRSALYQAASQQLGQPRHRELEQELARQALTLLHAEPGMLPLVTEQLSHIHLLAATPLQARMLRQSLSQHWPEQAKEQLRWTESSFDDWQPEQALQLSQQADLVIHAGWQRLASLVDLGGMADAASQQRPAMSYAAAMQASAQVLQAAKHADTKVILLGFGTPYELIPLMPFSDISMLAYHHGIEQHGSGLLYGPTYQAVAEALLGHTPMHGELPVRLTVPDLVVREARE